MNEEKHLQHAFYERENLERCRDEGYIDGEIYRCVKREIKMPTQQVFLHSFSEC